MTSQCNHDKTYYGWDEEILSRTCQLVDRSRCVVQFCQTCSDRRANSDGSQFQPTFCATDGCKSTWNRWNSLPVRCQWIITPCDVRVEEAVFCWIEIQLDRTWTVSDRLVSTTLLSHRPRSGKYSPDRPPTTSIFGFSLREKLSINQMESHSLKLQALCRILEFRLSGVPVHQAVKLVPAS